MLTQTRSPVSESGRNHRPLSNKPKGNKSRGSNKRGSTMKNFFKKQQMGFGQNAVGDRSYDKRIK